jgi:hypothetical protein
MQSFHHWETSERGQLPISSRNDVQPTYDVNASTEAAFRLKLRERLGRFHFLVDFCRVVDIDSSVVGCGGEKLAFWTDGQGPMFACLLAWK